VRSIAGLVVWASLSCAADVPKGTVTAGQATSKIYPGAVRKYWVYVPAQYNAAKPTCVMVFQDGGAMVAETGEWRTPLVLDSLIQQGRIPPVIAVFIDPGVLPGPRGRDNRSYEYDGPGDRYARLVSEEILPEVAARYNLSKNPNDYAIAGAGSGATVAIHAAWARPDVFRRVASFTGSDAELSDMLPVLVRKTEPKPLRVFLQDSDKHRDLSAALQSAGYESTSFKGARGETVLAEALRWIWKDYPKPVEKRSQEWELVGQGYQLTADPTVDREGNVFFTDARRNRIYKIGADGKIALWKENTGGAHGIAAGPDGRLYVGQHDHKRILALAADGVESTVTEGVQTHHLVVTARNEIYFADGPNHTVWLIDTAGKRRAVTSEMYWPHCMRISADQSMLAVTDSHSRWVWSFQIQRDGSLANGQPFYRLESADDAAEIDAGGMDFDTEGRLYVATSLGIQICDRLGRVVNILNLPGQDGLTNVFFAGRERDWLYAMDGDRIYRRRRSAARQP
jgi:sugar lactone lactonase YvrE